MDVYRVGAIGGAIAATVYVPGSKSVANRALVCAALASGTTVLDNLPDGDDTEAMLDCLEALGLDVTREIGRATIDGGVARFKAGSATLPARLAGTTSRFITAVAALGRGAYTIDGLAPLRRRPMADLHDALRSMGASVTALADEGHLPVRVQGPLTTLDDTIEVTLRGDISSQFLSALMLVAPYTPQGVRFLLSTELVSRPYVRMTAAVMEAFGVGGVQVGDRIITVPAGEYQARTYEVEPDASSASYPLAAAAICGGTVSVPGLGTASMQGDAAFCKVLERMGCDISQTPDTTSVSRRGGLHGAVVDLADMSDLVPTVAAVACFATGTTEIHGVGFIRNKESDRIGDLCSELRKAGIDAQERPDGLVVHGGGAHSASLATHHDHRLAMAFALVGIGAGGIAVEDPDVVSKSWPDFWTMIEGLR
jgi:3-phosphoshikimate 1-carboxyvinyltransferase